MIYNYYHTICGLSFQTVSPLPVRQDRETELFKCGPRNPDFRILLEPVAEIPTHKEKNCGIAGDHCTWRRGNLIFRNTKDAFRPDPHMEISYDVSDCRDIHVKIREEYWQWAASSKYFWPGVFLNMLLVHRRALMMHASCIGIHGQGILFSAASGTGKSTQAELWRVCRGAEIINGDKAGISIKDKVLVHGVPFSGSSGISQNRTLPLSAIVLLSQEPENTIRKLGVMEAVPLICRNVFADRTVQEEWSMLVELLLDIAEQVPVYSLACTPDERAVETLEKVLL